MRFIHVGDTHIGKVYKDERRNEDVKDSFRQLIDYAIKNRPDFIVHAGDLFNEGDPSLNDLLFVTDELNKLRQNGIKIFIVPGSHDIGMGEEDSIVELFDRNGLLVNLNSKRYIKYTDEGVMLRGETYHNAFICGIRGKRSRVEDEIFKKLKIASSDPAWIKIFLFHHTISSLGEQFKDLDTESLPTGFNYYAAGHWHGHRDNIHYNGGVIQYPGSTEYCDEKEMVDNPDRGFYVVDYGSEGITGMEYVKLKTRERDIFRINCDGRSADEIESEAKALMKKNDGKLLIIKLEGKMRGQRGELDVASVKNCALSNGYVYVSVNSSKLSDKDATSITLQSKDIASVEKEFLKAKGYSDKEIELADFMMSAAETKSDISGVIKRIEDAMRQ